MSSTAEQFAQWADNNTPAPEPTDIPNQPRTPRADPSQGATAPRTTQTIGDQFSTWTELNFPHD